MIIGIFAALVVVGVIVFFIVNKGTKKTSDNLTALVDSMSKQTELVNKQIENMRSELNNRLSETNRAISETHKTVGERLDNATKIFGNVSTSLGQLNESSRQLLAIGRDISSLQELLRAPKFRGEIGETMLENILTQVLPKENFKLQYRFKTGDTVDAIIELAGHLVPVDSKFSLENFKKMIEAPNEAEKNVFHRKFISDLKARIDEISKKYILPDEKTFDFALMYIMAENVYYETIVKGDLLGYALSKKVIPVSPNTFYAYLQVICLGLRGMKIESNVQKVLASLSGLQGELVKFQEVFRIVGGHIRNATLKYDEAEKKLERFSDKLISVENHTQIEKLP